MAVPFVLLNPDSVTRYCDSASRGAAGVKTTVRGLAPTETVPPMTAGVGTVFSSRKAPVTTDVGSRSMSNTATKEVDTGTCVALARGTVCTTDGPASLTVVKVVVLGAARPQPASSTTASIPTWNV